MKIAKVSWIQWWSFEMREYPHLFQIRDLFTTICFQPHVISQETLTTQVQPGSKTQEAEHRAQGPFIKTKRLEFFPDNQRRWDLHNKNPTPWESKQHKKVPTGVCKGFNSLQYLEGIE